MNFIQAHLYKEDNIPPHAYKLPLFISSCGHFCDIDQPIGAYRPKGRSDYQILFVTDGCLYAKKHDETEIIIPSNSIVVFKPYERQVYFFKPEESPQYYWIHFGGTQAEMLLKQLGLYDKFYYTDMNFKDYMSTIDNIISEIRLKRINYEMQCCLYLCEMLINICRKNSDEPTTDNAINRLMPALTVMEREMNIHRSIEDYANLCSITPFHFMHLFKKSTGFTVIQYKNNICMERAMHLLKHSSMTINEIAESIGIEDRSYFSKKFKNYYGFSPTKFRK